ncbi:MAG: hypothetical protein ABI999_10565 [Acidobacteriota bacterium]
MGKQELIHPGRNENSVTRHGHSPFKEKGQYLLAFGVIASMLLIVGFPSFVVFFFGVFAYFLWKIFSSGSRSETREIFEFYLSANDVLRDDERRWFGFEMKEVVGRGEKIVKNMVGAPPLVYFALGALYNKIGDHNAAVTNLSYVVENESSEEKAMVYPSPELRNYVRILRKIEREPAEAPLTSSAVRALERARRNRARLLLENSRNMMKLSDSAVREQAPVVGNEKDSFGNLLKENLEAAERKPMTETPSRGDERITPPENRKEDSPFTDRKSISEVLHDIYDGNIQ